MPDDEMFATLSEIIRTLFDEYHGPVTPGLSARDVPQWDSLANVQFMVMVEKSFKLRFTTAEIQNANNLGEIIALVEKKRRK